MQQQLSDKLVGTETCVNATYLLSFQSILISRNFAALMFSKFIT
jgi:hypothetical protein